jgi:hypothetical protein
MKHTTRAGGSSPADVTIACLAVRCSNLVERILKLAISDSI